MRVAYSRRGRALSLLNVHILAGTAARSSQDFSVTHVAVIPKTSDA